MWAAIGLNEDDSPLIGSKSLPLPPFYTVKNALPYPPGQLPPERALQEALIFEDLIYILSGSEGNYIHFSPEFDPNSPDARLAGPDFAVPHGIDPAVRDVILGLVSTAKIHGAVAAAAEELSASKLGRVNQALGATLREFCDEFMDLIAAIELEAKKSTDFTLHDLILYIQPSQVRLEHSYGALEALLSKAHEEFVADRNRDEPEWALGAQLHGSHEMLEKSSGATMFLKGGAVLKVISHRMELYRGDPVALNVLETLLKRASAPYLEMLRSWVLEGAIDDPIDEFMIRETQTLAPSEVHADFADDYWERRYTLRPDLSLPATLASSDVSNQVLLAGKYLNVIQNCGGDETSLEGDSAKLLDDITDILDTRLVLAISQAYHTANSALLKLLLDKHDLEARLVSFKQAFFLDQSDFLPLFLESTAKELNRSLEQTSLSKIQAALELAIAQPGSVSSQQPYLDSLKVGFASNTLVDELISIASVSGVSIENMDRFDIGSALVGDRGDTVPIATPGSLTALQALELDVQIPFPLSLVITRNSIYRYQFLFRQLLGVKVVLQILSDAWTVQTKSVVWKYASALPELQAWKLRAQELRARMKHVLEQLLYYFAVDVIESTWREFYSSLRLTKTVDGLRDHHLSFLDKCMRESMLTIPELLKSQTKLLRAGRLYGQFLQSHDATLAWVDPSVLTNLERAHLEPIVSAEGQPYTHEDLMDFLRSTLDQYEVTFQKYTRNFVQSLNKVTQTESSTMRMLLARWDI